MPIKDLAGQKFGKLTAVRGTTRRNGNGRVVGVWECKCECGGKSVVRADSLSGGRVKSCGCGRRRGPGAGVSIKKNGGLKNPNWRGGVKHNSDGYILIKKPDHPRADLEGYVMEHRLVMEAKLGRALTRDEVVHHVDGNRANNAPENLILFGSHRVHRLYHARKRNDIIDPVFAGAV